LGVSRVLGVWVHEEHEFDVAAREEGVDVVVLEGVDAFEVEIFIGPLHLFHHVESSVDDELVHVFSFVSKARSAITAEFGGPKFELEERVVASADNGEVIGHDDREWK